MQGLFKAILDSQKINFQQIYRQHNTESGTSWFCLKIDASRLSLISLVKVHGLWFIVVPKQDVFYLNDMVLSSSSE